ncbi:hypothetical protein [Chlamydia sp. 17-3921]|uniref:hypothetical protein n=1 Tax=Chlamydia sp. 17-3921 TaxID=2675798 RepID=UPI00191ADD70|nr:hypothetical protein [Chlamydia sp. 17-3921]
MKINGFDPYGTFLPQEVAKDSHQGAPTLSKKISEEIATNEAIRLALLAISDQEQENKKNKHRFKLLNQKQAKILLSQLRHVQLDFRKLRGDKEKDQQEEKEPEKYSQVKASGKKKICLGASASQAIAAAAEAWVIARNKGILDMATTIFWKKDNE